MGVKTNMLSTAISNGIIAILTIIGTTLITLLILIITFYAGKIINHVLEKMKIKYDTRRNIVCISMIITLLFIVGIVISIFSYLTLIIEQ